LDGWHRGSVCGRTPRPNSTIRHDTGWRANC